jgi:hypothetical protein
MMDFEKVRALGRYSTILKGLVKKKVITQEQRKELIKELKGKVNEMSIEDIHDHIKNQRGGGKRKGQTDHDYVEECKEKIKDLESARDIILKTEIKKEIKLDILNNLQTQILEQEEEVLNIEDPYRKSKIRKIADYWTEPAIKDKAKNDVSTILYKHEHGKSPPQTPKRSFVKNLFWGDDSKEVEKLKRKYESDMEELERKHNKEIAEMARKRNTATSSSSAPPPQQKAHTRTPEGKHQNEEEDDDDDVPLDPLLEKLFNMRNKKK